MNKKEIICYETDASMLKGRAEKVLFPTTQDEIKDIIKNSNLDIVPRGAGTGLEGGAIPNDSIIIDLSKMKKVLNLNPVKRTVSAEAGVTLRELNEKLKSRGFEFPMDTLNQGVSTIGGMIATNASGRRSMRYGAIKEWIEEIELINGKAEIIKIGRADLTDVCGLEGITGIIISAKLKLIPLMKRTASIFQSDSLEDMLLISRRLKSESDVIIIELFSPKISEILEFPKKYNLFIEFDSERGKIKNKDYKELSKKLERTYYKAALEGFYLIEDPKLFFDKLKEFILFIESRDIPYVTYPGSGIIHSFFKKSEQNKIEEFRELIKKSKIKFGRFGFGIKRKSFLDSFEEKIIQRTKSRYDPSGKFNRGKIIDGFYCLKPAPKEEEKEAVLKKNLKPFSEEENSVPETVKEIYQEELKTEKEERLKKPEMIQETTKESVFEFQKKPLAAGQDTDIGRINHLFKDGNAGIYSPVSPNPKKSEGLVDYNAIRDIMTNKYKKEDEKNKTNDIADKKNGD